MGARTVVEVTGKVILAASVSPDGFFADESGGARLLFDWYGNAKHLLDGDRRTGVPSLGRNEGNA